MAGWLSGFEPRVAYSQAEVTRRRTGTLLKTPCLRGECGPCPVFALYPGIRLTTEKNRGKTSVRVLRRCLAEQRWAGFASAWPASIDLLTSVTFSLPSAELQKKRVLHTSKLRVEFLGQDSDAVGEEVNSQIVVNLPITLVNNILAHERFIVFLT